MKTSLTMPLFASVLMLVTGCSAPRQSSSYLVGSASAPSEAKPRPSPRHARPGPIVFLDAGHGGRDGGAAVKGVPLQEKALALEIVRRVERLLDGWEYPVVLSRWSDIFVPLQKRVAMAARANASLFVSVHFNSAASKKSRGAEIYYFHMPRSQRSIESKRLGTAILKRLCEALPTHSRGVKHGNFCVVRETAMPAVLVEAAFITNPKEAKLLTSASYKQQIAWAIAQGISDYLRRA